MHILFVCSANKDRSKTAEVFLALEYPQHTFASAGTNQKICKQLGTEFITKDVLDEADLVLAMEPKHLKFIKERVGKGYVAKVKVLNIPDLYEFGDATLKVLLKERVGRWLN